VSWVVKALIDLLVLGFFVNIWVLMNSEMVEIGEDENTRILPSEFTRKWLSDTYLELFMAKYRDIIYKISTGDEEPTTTKDKLRIRLTEIEINNLFRKVKSLVPGRDLNFSKLVIVESNGTHIVKYLIGESSDTLILSKVSFKIQCFY
jgi:hypothetical protein